MKVIFLFPCGCQWTQLFSFFVRWFGILALVCLSEFLLPAAAAAESFTAVGSGPTEQAAIQDAFRQAIRVQWGISLSADTYVINQQVARDQMHASMQGHIRSYRLLDSHFDGESYQVRLQVEIADGPDGETSDLTEHSSSAPSALKPAIPVKKSVTDEYIICLEDGAKLKMLKRYLRTHYDMSPDEYRAKWGLPSDYPMVAPNYAQARSEMAKRIGLGKLTPASGRGRKKKAA